eukprot:GILI01006979.1.p1 GENE.GILI01006979.1~~GILI01006979.1.p1  ORF type:complete len:220 (+),score=68.80 GILI01006979.1:54-713(+)
MCCIGVKSLTFLVLVAACLVGFHYVIDNPANWVFDPIRLQELSKKAITKAGPNATSDVIVQAVIKEVTGAYPKYAFSTGEWMFNNAGGAMGSMTVLHSSFSEYLIIFGTALGTEGHTGRFMADDYFTIIDGEQWAQPADSQAKEIYRPGDQHHLVRGEAKQYRMPDNCWALEYARGNIPSMLFFGFGDGLFSTFDFVSLAQTVKASAGYMFHNLMIGKI